jgi:hypothetical protein
VQAAWNDGPDAVSPTWSDLTTVERLETGPRGRTYELDTVVPTRSRVRLDNTDASYGSIQRTNLIVDPSFEAATSFWSSDNGSIVRTATTTPTDGGSYVAQVTAASSAPLGLTPNYTSSIKIAPNSTYTFQGKIRQLSSGSLNFQASLAWVTTGLQSTGTTTRGTIVASVQNNWINVSVTATAPPKAAWAIVYIYTTANAAVGSVWQFDELMFEPSSNVGAYFDGNSANCAWNGTVNNSPSINLGTITTDRQIRASVSWSGSTYRLFTGNIEAAPSTLDSGQFDYASATYSTIDRQDQLLTTTLRSGYVEWTLKQNPTLHLPLGETAGSTIVGDLAKGNNYSVIDLKQKTATIVAGENGFANFGDSPMYPLTDPTTCCNFLPISDGGGISKVIRLASAGVGTFVTGNQYAIRFMMRAPVNSSTVNMFYQGDTYTGTSPNLIPTKFLNIALATNGQISATFPTSSGFTNLNSPTTTKYNDSYPHIVELWVSTSRQSLFVDGVEVAFSTVTPSTLTASGSSLNNVYIGAPERNLDASAAVYGFGFEGSIGHFSIFDSSYVTGAASSATAALAPTAAGGFAGEAIDTRIGRVLDWVSTSIPRTLADSATYGAVCGPLNCSGTSAWQTCVDTMNVDGGVVWVDANNAVRTVSYSTRSTASSKLTLGTNAFPVASSNLTFDVDRQHLVNEFQATYVGGPILTFKDATSQARYRRRNTNSTINFGVNSATDLATRAGQYLAKYAYPRARVGSVTLDIFSNPAFIPYVMTWEPNDRITITNLPSTAPAQTMDFHIEGISHNITPTSWQTILQLSPYVPIS